ncbi:MAG: M50 family metallopeptidase [Candidatus Saccharibacteria bacterium]|nr:M50 family metallopeptidase [Candidatus Saccharibacteria bacterium]
MAIVLLILGILLFVGLVVVHEFGHFIAARRNGVEVEEFGIGFPPRAKVLTKKHGTTYTLNWLPLGGFVKLKGEHDEDDTPGSYGAAKLGAKVKILLAGVGMNFLVAAILFTTLALVGMPKANLADLPFYDREQFSVAADTELVSSQIFVGVVEDSPAAEAGLQSGDELQRVDGEVIERADELPAITESLRGQTVDIEYVRDGEVFKTSATLNEDANGQGYLGVAPADAQVIRATWSAPIVGAVSTLQYTDVSLRGLGYVVQNLFAGKPEVAGEAVGGPVAVFMILSDTAAIGIAQVLFVIALVSVSLGIMNALPIPALDGGRLFVTLIFRTLKKPLNKELEERIHGTGFMVLMLLIVVITVVDIRRFF